MLSRLAAWLITGPLGHGYAALLDVAALLAVIVRERRRARRDRGGPA